MFEHIFEKVTQRKGNNTMGKNLSKCQGLVPISKKIMFIGVPDGNFLQMINKNITFLYTKMH